MSVWPEALPAGPLLSANDGALVSVSIDVDPRYLESCLEALAQAPFPINPQIYHNAAIVYRYADGHEETRDTTLVEFPAYASWMSGVRQALEAYGFDSSSVRVTGMLDEIHAEAAAEAAPAGAPYVAVKRAKRKTAGLA